MPYAKPPIVNIGSEQINWGGIYSFASPTVPEFL